PAAAPLPGEYMTFPPPHHPAAPVNPCPERKLPSWSWVGLHLCRSQFPVSDPEPMYGARPTPGPMGLQYQLPYRSTDALPVQLKSLPVHGVAIETLALAETKSGNRQPRSHWSLSRPNGSTKPVGLFAT